MLIGLWRKDSGALEYAVPRAKKFADGKRPQWERATAACLLAIYDKNPKEAGIQLEIVCKAAMRADFDSTYKMLFVPAHGLYQLAAYLWDEELFFILFPVFGGEMATAKIQTVKGLRVEIFSRPVRKNTTRP